MMNRHWNVVRVGRSACASRVRIATAFIACCMIGWSVHARATVLIGADLGDLSHDAVAIARGRIAAVTPQWTDDRRTVETLVTLEVDEYLKGALGASVQFRVPGGDFGRFRTIVVGAPEFDVDEQVIVFLGARGPSVPYVLGFNQGVYRLVSSADGSASLVMPPPVLPTASAGTVRIVRGDSSRRPMPLDAFEQHVRELAGGAR